MDGKRQQQQQTVYEKTSISVPKHSKKPLVTIEITALPTPENSGHWI
jgi:hypothetical protein